MERVIRDELSRLTGDMVQQVNGFAPWLRRRGFRAGIPETLTAVRAMRHLDVTRMEAVAHAFRAVYARSAAEWEVFPSLFERYFCGRGARLEEKRPWLPEDELGTARNGIQDHGNTVETMGAQLPGHHPSDGERFALRADHDLVQDVVNVTRLATRTMAAPRGRRWQARGRGRMDVRRTVRGALRHTGEPFVLAQRSHRPDKPRIVLLLDISGSMKPYASFFTTLAWSFTRTSARVQIFLFSTRLLRVTSIMARKALAGIPYTDLPGLRGGTRIGGAIDHLLHRYPGLLHRHACIIIASDGFDAGHPAQLQTAMRDLSAGVGRVVWLNPLLSEPGYEPTSVGLSTAVPYVDAFVDVHDVASWKQAVLDGVLRKSTHLA